MAPSSFHLLLVVSLNFLSSNSKPVDLLHNGKQRSDSTDFDAEIEEISKRDYQTVHGRILAVNMAHLRKKRQVAGNESVDGNAFKGIEEVNKANISAFYQGDIQLDPELEELVRGNSRNAVREKKLLWNTRNIPYRIPSYMSHITFNVHKAIQELRRKTCLRFVNYNSAYHSNYILFGNSDGCSSRVGKRYAKRGHQEISIGDGCNNVGTILHEMLHAIGFFHEQSRNDRDEYVKIYWENIIPIYKDQFDKYSWITLNNLGVAYDYQSIMHYDRRAFTKNGKPTIVAIGNENMEFRAPDRFLSTRDAIEINALYECGKTSYGWASWSEWTPCDNKCYRTRERFCYNSGNQQACGGNVNVYGVEKQREKCPSSICPAPIDGHWGRWSNWSPCSKTCNDGVKTRFRKCDNPTPGHGGKQCPGSASEKSMCILKRCNLGSDDTDFENWRLAIWSNSKSDNLDWTFHRSYTQTVDTGPSADHTTGLGYYLYAESSQRNPGDRAVLDSPWLPVQNGGQCFKFYYTMYGKTMGSLAVKVELSDGRNWYIFYEQGNKGEGWKKGIGNMDFPTGLKYRLSIIAKIGNAGYSDIAIDDVYIDPGLCSCQDDYHTCYLWAAKGDCTTNEVWMKQNCKRSCRACIAPIDGHWGRWSNWSPCSKTCNNGVKTRTRICNSPAPAHGGKQCPGSANEEVVCIFKRCNLATPKPTIQGQSCRDSSGYETQCPKWAATGECKKNPNWMLVNCKKSCSEDSNANCPAWAKLGECTKNPGWMLVNCKLSCNQC